EKEESRREAHATQCRPTDRGSAAAAPRASEFQAAAAARQPRTGGRRPCDAAKQPKWAAGSCNRLLGGKRASHQPETNRLCRLRLHNTPPLSPWVEGSRVGRKG